MKAYIITLIGTALIAAIVTVLAPEGKGGGIGRHIKLLTALALLCVIITPAVSFLKTLFDADLPDLVSVADSVGEYTVEENILNNSLISVSRAELESNLKALLCDNFNINHESISVRAEYSTDKDLLVVNRFVVVLSGEAIFKNPHKIEAFVSELTEIKCDCVIE